MAQIQPNVNAGRQEAGIPQQINQNAPLPTEGRTKDVFHSQYILDKGKIDLQSGSNVEHEKPYCLSSSQITLPNSYENLINVCEMLKATFKNNQGVEVPGHYVLHNNMSNAPLLISFFTIYPVFGPFYNQYMKNPDSNVTFAQMVQTTFVADARNVVPVENQIRATIYIGLLMMTKNFPIDATPEQIKGYFNKRWSVAKALLIDDTIEPLLKPEALLTYRKIWTMLPNFKLIVFEMMMSMQDVPEFRAASKMLSYGSMVTITCMLKFIDCKVNTVAHSYSIIKEETEKFKSAVKSIREELGIQWPYYRILRTNDNSLAASKFPNLAKASVIYSKTFLDTSETFSRIKEPNVEVAAGLLAAATQKEAMSASTIQAIKDSLTEEQKAVARRFRIDLETWIPPQQEYAGAQGGCNRNPVPDVRGNERANPDQK